MTAAHERVLAVRRRLGNLVLRHVPWAYLWYHDLRYGRSDRAERETARRLNALSPGEIRVQRGPFAGMKYLPVASGSGLLPKIVGTYERELQPVLEEALLRPYSRIVNIGAAEGYYSVGLALRLPEVEIVAFEGDPLARRRLRRLARSNGVQNRVQLRTWCRPRSLAKCLGRGRTFVLSDCEGDEMTLLDPARIATLRHVDLLVEIHDFVDPTIGATLLSRFAASHEIVVIRPEIRHESDGVAGMTPLDSAHILDEGRPEGLYWAWMQSASSPRIGLQDEQAAP